MGSGFISNRMQRFFTTLAISKPPNDTVTGIFKRILSDHFRKFDKKIQGMSDGCIEALNRVFQKILVEPKLSPTARKFFYKFNLRDVSRVVEGLLMAKKEFYSGEPHEIAKLWLHESERVFKDRLFPEDYDVYFEKLKSVNEFEEFEKEKVYGVPDADGN
jgi:dynein heavy chain